MSSFPPSAIDSEEAVDLDESTAPTTPEGSLSFSPVLRPRNGGTGDVEGRGIASISLSLALEASLTVPHVNTICCVGAGYVGGPTAAVIAFQNPHIRVTVVDKDDGRIRRWNSRHPPIYEPGLSDIVRIARDGSRAFSLCNEPSRPDSLDSHSDASTCSSECGSQCGEQHPQAMAISARQPNLFFSTNVASSIAAADIVLIAVNTPTKYRGIGAGSATDMTAFEAVTAVVAQHAKPGAIIVEKSTVPCRTAEFVQETLAHHRRGVRFEVLSNPEFLAAGTAMKDLLAADRILIGCSPTPSGHRAAAALASVYSAWIPAKRIITTNVFSSELAKLVANSMLAQRISSINSIAAVCEATGADVDEVASAVGADARIGSKFLRAGIGFGGSCFKKDVLSLVYLAESLNLPEVADFWRAVVSMNEYSRNRFSARIVRRLNNTLRGKKITLLGYAFKPDTNDTRESPALELIQSLLDEGPREIAVFDPCCIPEVVAEEITRLIPTDNEPVRVYANAYEACNASDAVIIATDFDEFKSSSPSPITSPAGNSTKVSSKTALTDPRPFERLEPTENDLFSLQRYLIRSSTGASEDPLDRFNDSPDCADDCPDCMLERSTSGTVYGAGTDEYKPKARLDWAKISYHMPKPRWVFDGRGVLDIREMEKLGFKIETVGRQAGMR